MIPALVNRGWKIFPVSKTKQPLVKWRDWATNDIKLITAEFAGRDVNVGIACGESGLLILDDDDDGEVVRLFNDHGCDTPDTYRVQTAKGWHYYFNGHADIGNRNPLKNAGYKIDVRGNGGFVVAAGSVHESGHIYTANDPDAEVLDAPGWLLGLLRAGSNGHTGQHIDLGVFEEERRFTLEQAEVFVWLHLERLRNAVVGDINTELNRAAKAMSHFGPEFWSRQEAERLLRVKLAATAYDGNTWQASDTIQSAYASADRDWKAVLVSEMSTEPIEHDYSGLYLTVGNLDRLPTPEPLIDGVLDKHALFVVAGRGDTFKSFLTFDWLASIATGRTWQGHEVEQAKVLLVVGEGAYGLRKRRDAWQMAWDTRIGDEWMHIRRAPINLFKGGADYTELLERVEHEQYKVILFDTLQRMTSGAESNSAKDAGITIARLGQIRSVTDGTVGVVAHEGKADGFGVRGSSAWEDDADIVWRVKRPDVSGMDISCTLAKRKDGPEGLVHTLRASTVDGTGSLVLEAATGDPFAANLPAAAGEILLLLGKPSVPSTGLTRAEIQDAIGKGKSLVHDVLSRLIIARKVRLDETGRWPRYVIMAPDAPDDGPDDE